MPSCNEAYVEFSAYVEVHGWEAARAWLTSAESGLTQGEIETVLKRAGRANLAKIRISDDDLTGNRMRKGASLW